MKILKEQFVEVPAEKCYIQFSYWFNEENHSAFFPVVKFSHPCFECNGEGTKESRIELKQSLHKLIEDLFEFEKKEDK